MTATIADRLRELVGDASVLGFAKRCGIPGSSMRQYLDGTVPGADKAAQIAERNGVSLLWLVTGEEPRGTGGTPVPPGFSGVSTGSGEWEDFAMVPRLVVQASAGAGALVEHEDVAYLIAFRASWLRKRGINPQAARALTVRGDSMEPTIRSGDVLLVDTSKDRVEDNGIYVVISGGYVLVKRVHPRRDGSLMLISDNQAYPSEDVPAGEAGDFHVAGRVMWFGRSI